MLQCAQQNSIISITIHFIVEFLFLFLVNSRAWPTTPQVLFLPLMFGRKNVSRRTENTKRNHRKFYSHPFCDNDTTCTHANKRRNTIKLFFFREAWNLIFLSPFFCHQFFIKCFFAWCRRAQWSSDDSESEMSVWVDRKLVFLSIWSSNFRINLFRLNRFYLLFWIGFLLNFLL